MELLLIALVLFFMGILGMAALAGIVFAAYYFGAKVAQVPHVIEVEKAREERKAEQDAPQDLTPWSPTDEELALIEEHQEQLAMKKNELEWFGEEGEEVGHGIQV